MDSDAQHKVSGAPPAWQRVIPLPRGKDQRYYAVSSWAVVGLVILTLGFLAWYRYDQSVRRAYEEAARSSRFTQLAISQRLDEQRRLVSVLASQQTQLLQRIVANPGDQAASEQLHSIIKAFFPDAFAVTIADQHGKLVVDDFEGMVGEVCQGNLHQFAKNGLAQPIFIHPNTRAYHYDIMVRFGDHIFFVSFRPDTLTRILEVNAALGQQLMLIKTGSRLIELTAQGSRDKLTRSFHLDEAEHDTALLRLPIPNTEWSLIALPNQEMMRQDRHEYIGAFLLSSIVVLSLATLMHGFIHFELRRRRQAEEHATAMANLSYSDSLTGLHNRRALDETLAREWLHMERSGEPLALMMVDVDLFKRYNDSLGHQEGDRCLVSIAQALKSALNRPRDKVGRYGGEEFMIILPNTPCSSAQALASAMHENVAACALPHYDSDVSDHVTISIGIACGTTGLTASPESLLRMADEALYQAKHQGRNTTVTGTPDA